jgi:hypothetical protein
MYSTYYTIKNDDDYTVDESFEFEDITIHTYLDPNGIHVIVGIGLKDKYCECKWVTTDEYTVVHIGGTKEFSMNHSVDSLPCSNKIQLYRDENGKVTTIVAFDRQHRIRTIGSDCSFR